MKRKSLVAGCITVMTLLLGVSQSVQASSMSYYLNQSNVDAGSLIDGINYAQVTIDDNTANKLTFAVTLLAPLTSIAGSNFGIQDFSFNFLGASSQLSDAAASNTQWTLPNSWSAQITPPPNQADGFGKFDAQVGGTGSSRYSPLVFSINSTALSLFSFAKTSNNGNGQGDVYFAAHIAGFNGPSGVTSGYFGGSTPVPVPAALPLLISALGGFGLFGRRKR